jgi:copper chaperone
MKVNYWSNFLSKWMLIIITLFEKAYFKVIGIYCTTCKPIVEKQLKDKVGIKRIDINYTTDSVVVEFDPALTNIQEIKERLEKSGYKFVRAPQY